MRSEKQKKYNREYQRAWKDKNYASVLKQAKKRYHAKSKEWKDAQVLRNKKYRHRIRLEALEHYGGKCVCCGESMKEFLCFDHINNNGSEHRKTMKDKSIAPWLKRNNYPEGFQILCHNCNIAKEHYGSCPHKGGNTL